MFDDVGKFHAKFELPHRDPARPPTILSDDVALYRAAFLLEEALEFMRAHQRNDMVEAADALVDLVYVALGTAHLMNLPWDRLWDEVQRANMLKERGATVKRGHALDVRKPPGWQPPNIATILLEAARRGNT